MNTVIGNRIILGGGILVVLVATWFAFKTPVAPRMPSYTTPDNTVDNGALAAASETTMPAAPIASAAKTIRIRFISPTSSSVLVIGQSYDITWNVAGGIHGQLYLVNAGTGKVIGWIEQHIGPAQVMYPWTVRSVLVNGTSPAAKDIAPGRYQLKITYPSAQVPAAESAVFVITATPTSTTKE